VAHPSFKDAAARIADDLVTWRRDLHRHPELGFEERRTASFVASCLEGLGLEVRTEVGATGVVGLLRSPRAEGGAVLLRADMDALPIHETDDRPYRSRVDGCMHACGHDGHTAMLLGAATLLAGRRHDLPRHVLFCFQPAEEGLGGAEAMIRDGVLDWVEVGSAYALHLWTPVEHGEVHVRSGPIMAAADEFTARILGKGGHGALPHVASDPIVAAAQAVGALQTVVSRGVDPLQAAVVTVGALHAGRASNVIPDEAIMEGTLRSFDDGVRQQLRARVPAVIAAAARAVGCGSEFDLRAGFPVTINDAAATEVVRRVAREAAGKDRVHETPPLPASEDFSYFLRERPGAFVLLGAGNAERGITAPHHSPEFDIDESVLPLGAELLARLAVDPEQP